MRVSAGFTLIELLVVITVLSILTVSVGLAMRTGNPRAQPGDDAARFLKTHATLQATAIHSSQPRGMMIAPQGWQVVRFDVVTGRWDRPGRAIRWQGTAGFRSLSPYSTLPVIRQPDLVFLPTGQTTAFELRFTQGSGSVFCHSDGWQGVTCDTR